jgi:hypothetical protein
MWFQVSPVVVSTIRTSRDQQQGEPVEDDVGADAVLESVVDRP